MRVSLSSAPTGGGRGGLMPLCIFGMGMGMGVEPGKEIKPANTALVKKLIPLIGLGLRLPKWRNTKYSRNDCCIKGHHLRYPTCLLEVKHETRPDLHCSCRHRLCTNCIFTGSPKIHFRQRANRCTHACEAD